MAKEAIILINVGTPDNYGVKAVRRYLRQFLNDRRVIDLPWLFQKILVNLIIVPFRAPKSAKLYKKLWTNEGSPLLSNMLDLREKLQKNMPNKYDVYAAMRYQNPSILKALQTITSGGYEKLTIIPLFPQYASSTSGTAIEAIWKIIRKWDVIPETKTISQFYQHPSFIEAFTRKIESYNPEEYDHVVFSYHGLPLRHLNKIHPNIDSSKCTCSEAMPPHGKLCYKASCYETTRLLVKKLGLKKGTYTTTFQSRLSKNWMTPFTDATLKQLALSGKKHVLIAAPSFVADCLETTVEIGYEYKNMFTKQGGKKLTMVESLNAEEKWINALVDIICN